MERVVPVHLMVHSSSAEVPVISIPVGRKDLCVFCPSERFSRIPSPKFPCHQFPYVSPKSLTMYAIHQPSPVNQHKTCI